MTFKFAGARAQVCKFCKFLVARTDRGLAPVGRVADLVEIPSPLAVGVMGQWGNRRFEVEGRVQLDRVGAASAPWQEFYVGIPATGEGFWVAFAQGRWYFTREILPPEGQALPLPAFGSLRPGQVLVLPKVGQVTIAEVGRRRVVSAEGELPNVAVPGAVTPYADFGGPGGVFGTIDFGDGQSLRPTLFAGQQFDPTTLRLDSGQSVEAPQAKVEACSCPGCGGSLPLVAPGTTERIVCRYCGTISDVAKTGALSALGQAPRPPVTPFVPLGAEGTLRGRRVICIAFLIRGTWVEGEHYAWREYLCYAGPRDGYVWLTEEDGHWQIAGPVPPGEAQQMGSFYTYQGKRYTFKQSVRARVEYVVGEVYWKVQVGEEVQATEYKGPDGILSVESDHNEANISFCWPLNPAELGQAFNIAPPPSPAMFSTPGGGSSAPGCNRTVITVLVVIALLILFFVVDCDGGGGGGGIFIGPSFGGK